MATSTLQYDPDAPVYASPGNTFKSVDLGATQDPTKVINEDKATVAGQLKGLLSSGSSLLKAAQSDSLRTSNARGLLNSSIAAGEGTKATIETATPIAQQDATTYANMYAANNAANNEGLLNNQVSSLETNKLLKQGEITGALAQQEIESQYAMQKMSTEEKVTLQKMSDDATMQRTLVENESTKLIQSMESSQQNKEALMAVVSNMGQDMLSAINSITLDQNLDAAAKQSAINSITTNYQASVNTAASIANLNLSWSNASTGGTTTAQTTPATTTPAVAPAATTTTAYESIGAKHREAKQAVLSRYNT